MNQEADEIQYKYIRERWGFSRNTLKKWAELYGFPKAKSIGKRYVYWSKSDLENWFKSYQDKTLDIQEDNQQ